VVLVQPGDAAAAAAGARGADVVDPGRLVGAGLQPTSMPCLWWDPCPAGSVETRDSAGALTTAGFERIARLLVAVT
jgi:hypothetical protein